MKITPTKEQEALSRYYLSKLPNNISKNVDFSPEAIANYQADGLDLDYLYKYYTEIQPTLKPLYYASDRGTIIVDPIAQGPYVGKTKVTDWLTQQQEKYSNTNLYKPINENEYKIRKDLSYMVPYGAGKNEYDAYEAAVAQKLGQPTGAAPVTSSFVLRPTSSNTNQTADTNSEPTTTLDDFSLQQIKDYLKTRNDLTETEKNFLYDTFARSDAYTSGQEVPTPERIAQWIQDSATQAQADTNPYYEKITAQELEDYKNKMADIRNEAMRYKQQEAASYKQKLAETKQNLRARGLTFSGINRATLGKETAIGVNEGYNAGLEGTLPTGRRYEWEDRLATWQQQARDLGTAAERELGSTALSGISDNTLASPYNTSLAQPDYEAGRTQPLYLPRTASTAGYYAGYKEKPSTASGTYTSEHELQRLKDIELAKQQRLRNYQLTL